MSITVFEFSPPQSAERPYTISEINAGIARIIEAGNTVVWIEAEISNWRSASSGHCYFKLKDQECQVPAVMWRSATAQLEFDPEDGMAVMAIASIRVYQKGGYYQLDIHKMQPAGKGALYIAFERLKRKLEEEGLFDVARKRPIPETVRVLGVITSRRGAAIRDIVKVVVTRAPQTDIVLIDCAVQGEKAASEIAAAIANMNCHCQVDCIIVGRGGGSIEDLWAFNEEIVARAIFNSSVPIISAVGHEIDFTIADFVADVRAPTPSAAAEMAVADTKASRRLFDALIERFSSATERFFVDSAKRYGRIISRRALRKPLHMLLEYQQNHDEFVERSHRAIESRMREYVLKLAQSGSRLQALSPLAVLGRGYSVVSTAQGDIIRDAGNLAPGQDIGIRFSLGRAQATVSSIDSQVPRNHEPVQSAAPLDLSC